MVLAILFSSQLVAAGLGRTLVFGRVPGAELVPAAKAWAGWLLPALLGAGAALWWHLGAAPAREVVELGIGVQLVGSALSLYVLRAEAGVLLAQRVAHVSLLLVGEPGRSAAGLEVREGQGVLRVGSEDVTTELVARASRALGRPVRFDAELACAVVRRLRFMAHGDVRGWREPGEGRILLGVVPAGAGPRRGLSFQVSFTGGEVGTLARLSAAPADLPVEG